jgi:hypothetical protein
LDERGRWRGVLGCDMTGLSLLCVSGFLAFWSWVW